jgi:hypothetical protein
MTDHADIGCQTVHGNVAGGLGTCWRMYSLTDTEDGENQQQRHRSVRDDGVRILWAWRHMVHA